MKNTMPLHIEYVPAAGLKPAEYNPRKHDKASADQLKDSIRRFGVVDPLVVNCAPGRENVVVGGHFRLEVLKELGMENVPAVYVNIPDIEQEKELNIRLNKNTGEFDWNLLANFSERFLKDVGFSSEELDEVFGIDDQPEAFDLEKELEKLDNKGLCKLLNGSFKTLGFESASLIPTREEPHTFLPTPPSVRIQVQ